MNTSISEKVRRDYYLFCERGNKVDLGVLLDFMSEILTFEISNDIQEIEIHGNKEGLMRLIKIIENVIKHNSHDHLMTPSWAGNKVTEEIQGNNTQLINKVTIRVG